VSYRQKFACFPISQLTFRSAAEKKRKKDGQNSHANDAAAAAADRRRDSRDVGERHDPGDVVQKVEEDSQRSGMVCAGPGQQDHLVVFTASVFGRLRA